MFEFHGWATIRYHTHDTDSALQEKCVSALADEAAQWNPELVRIVRHNGCDCLVVNGLHNRRAPGTYVFDLFQWVAENAPGSYGVLYVWDEDDVRENVDYTNSFRAWVLRRGQLHEAADPFLSPCVPTVEDPFDPTRDD